ncbi:MAG: sugar ABC transporter ATP-binding protein [Firmicutes bacterium]|nr:sugar ABC transporter ATP-binding protein [Bacillota bacterium]
MSDGYLLDMRGISKRFQGIVALDNVDFKVRPGEIHALVGENGAGKSTLIKILSGIHRKDSGSITFRDTEVDIQGPRHAQQLGIATVHQELNLIPALSVRENVFLGRLPHHGSLGVVDWDELERNTEKLLGQLGVELDPKIPVRELGVAERQLVEIVKALSCGARLVIMDEPTSALSQGEVRQLFDIVKGLKAKGVTFIFVSHRLEELFQIADSITVLRDGRVIGTKKLDEVTYNQIVGMMVGRELTDLFPKVEVEIGEPVLRVEGLSRVGEFENISFEVRSGEILGIAGLMGAGRTELARSIYGIKPPTSGSIYMDGRRLKISRPTDAIKHGIYLLPEDRKNQGLVRKMTVRENTSLSVLSSLSMHGFFINRNKERANVEDAVDRLNVKTPSIEQLVENLSGGNQQKVVFAKGMLTRPRVLILDEPTRGIDVGAKREIHRLMGEFAQAGGAVIMISSELPEVLGMSDRIIVMARGRITGEFLRHEATQEGILRCALGG